MNEFKGKVAVVTGAASGIGRAIALHCAQEKMNVVLADVEKDALTRTEEELKTNGASVLAVVTDVSQFDDVLALKRETHNTFGAVHLLFSNAGVVLPRGSIWESSYNDWKWIVGVNLWGAVHATLAFVPMMIAQEAECHIVYTASSAGLTSSSGGGPYGVTKHGVVSLSETLSLQLAEKGTKIHVSVLCPEYVNTRLWSSERNRPSELRSVPGTILQTADTTAEKARRRINFDEGILAELVADYVFDAIRNNKFYITTHPDTLPGVKKRMENILQGHNPED